MARRYKYLSKNWWKSHQQPNNFRYADNTMIITENLIDLELLVNKLKYPRANVCLELNLAKTKVMTTEKSQNFKI